MSSSDKDKYGDFFQPVSILHPKFGVGFSMSCSGDPQQTVLSYKGKTVTEEVTFKVYVEERDIPFIFIQHPTEHQTSEQLARDGAAQFMEEGFCDSDKEGRLIFYTSNRIELIAVEGDLVNLKEA